MSGTPAPQPRLASGNGSRIGKSDALMLLTVLFWAVNLSSIKIGLREFSPGAFNAVRLTLASLVYLGVLGLRREGFRLPAGDWWRAVLMGVFGITAYQLFFIQAINETHVSTASVVMATSPIFIAVLSTALGQERLHWAAWMGIVISFGGFLIVVAGENGGAAWTWAGVRGAVLILGANACWAGYTVFSKPLLDRVSPFKLAALSTAAGTFLYLPFTTRDMAAVRWRGISAEGWGAIGYSGLVAIVLCFVIWYVSLKKVGSAKTGIYSNMTPIFATVFAALFLGEGVSAVQVAGSAIVLAGVYLTRSGYRLFLGSDRVKLSNNQ
jgi:drug/metabolite transporter (DMT)-like permease